MLDYLLTNIKNLFPFFFDKKLIIWIWPKRILKPINFCVICVDIGIDIVKYVLVWFFL